MYIYVCVCINDSALLQADKVAAPIFYYPFTFMMIFIVLNMTIAIIMDGYTEAQEIRKEVLTCFTGTKVQILPNMDGYTEAQEIQKEVLTCFTGTKVQILPDMDGYTEAQEIRKRYSVYMLYRYKVQILTQLMRRIALETRNFIGRYSVYLLYWYKNTNTDAAGAYTEAQEIREEVLTCFTGTKVQILAQLGRSVCDGARDLEYEQVTSCWQALLAADMLY